MTETMFPWWRQREYRFRYTVKDDGISQGEVYCIDSVQKNL